MFIASLIALLLLLIPPPAAVPLPQPSEALFAGEIPRLRVEIAAEDIDRLRNDPRGLVKASLNDGERTIDVGIRLKGSAGSFREVDDRPALTVDVDRFDSDARFRGLKKFHLNNSVQDDSYLNEALATEMFRAAGIPATRVTHAPVWLNGRDLGLYVLKESFDVQFLRRHFSDASGNLYDGGLLQDIDAELKLESGRGPSDRSDLAAIVRARSDEDFGRGVTSLESLLDMDSFLSFMAVERLIC